MGTENTNENFSFEPENDTFFEETAPVTTSTQDVLEEVINSDITKPADQQQPTAEAEEEEEEVFFFGEQEKDTKGEVEEAEEEEEDDNNPPTDTQKPATTVKVGSKSTLEFLKEKGLVDYELEEGTELTEELAEEILEDNWEESVEATAGEKIKDLPDGLKQMIQIALKGGDYTGVLKNIVEFNKTGITADLDLEVEANQELVVRENLKREGHDQEYIDANIEFLKDGGKLKGISEKLRDKLVSEQKAKADAEVERVAKSKEAVKEKQRQFKADAVAFISNANNLKGLVINKKDKEELPSYISDVSVSMEDGRQVTALQKDLFEIFGDKESLTILAKLVRSKFDFSSITAKSITDYSNSIKEGVQNEKKKPAVAGSKGSSQTSKKSLADYL